MSRADPLPHPEYRPDIDGLRAVAVLLVVGFHAFPNRVQAGFIGVDIFFVISGYLISAIIMKGLDAGRFSFAEFYIRRARRIFPALCAVLAATLAAGWFTLLAVEFKALGHHAAAGAAFLANIAYWADAGYFDAAAETKPLLHLWSLGIEEQFYIVWPLLLWTAWSRPALRLPLLAGVLALSFAWNVHLAPLAPEAAFYSPATRFWELLVGATAAWLALYRADRLARLPAFARNALALAGAALIAACLASIDRFATFPGWWAALPTLGAALLILTGPRTAVSRLLALRPAVWIGLISYPFYLWHWPILAYLRIALEPDPGVAARLLAVLAAVVLSGLTYRLVERPLRFGGNPRARALGLSAALAGLGALGLALHAAGGLPGTGFRTPDREAFADAFDNSRPDWRLYRRLNTRENYREDCNFYDLEAHRTSFATRVPRPAIAESCTRRDPARPHAVFLWGDSHAQQLNSGLRAALPPDWQVLQVAASSCPADFANAEPSATDYCRRSNWEAINAIRAARPDVVVLARARGHDAAQIAQTARRLKEIGVPRVVLAGPSPHWRAALPMVVLRRLWPETPRRATVWRDPDAPAVNAALARAFPDESLLRYVDIQSVFCDAEGCLVYLGDDRLEGLTAWDGAHLTPNASAYLARHALADAVLGRR